MPNKSEEEIKVEVNPLVEKFVAMRDAVDEELQEREDLAETAVLALVAKKHHFQLGPPGIAKSLLVERICTRIGGFPDGGYFHRLLTKYTTDDELFGPADVGALMNEGRFVRNTGWKLPQALIAFIDEIFKGNSSVLNALLLAMNERKFDDEKGPVTIPLISIFAASNELPQGEELNAMWDRLHIRHHVNPLQDGESFISMLDRPLDPDPPKIITLDDIAEANKQAATVVVPRNVLESLAELRSNLGAAGIHPTDRRWVNSLDVIKAAAWMDGLTRAEVYHTRPLMHMMWDRDEDIRKATGLVLDLADPNERKAQGYYDDLIDLEEEFNKSMQSEESAQKRSSSAVEIYSKMERLDEQMEALEDQIEEGREMKIIKVFRKRLREVSMKVMAEGFNIPEDELE